MATLCYEKPGSFDELFEQFSETSSSYMDGLEACHEEVFNGSSHSAKWEFEGPVRSWTFYYVFDGNDFYFSTSDFLA